MSSPPSSLPVSLIAARTLFSSVISQRKATARTPKLLRSITVCCASRPECKNVMATSAPAFAIAKAVARPRRRAPPVIKTVFPFKGLSDVIRMNGLYLLPRRHPERTKVREGSRAKYVNSLHRLARPSPTHWQKPAHPCYTQPNVESPPGRGLLPQRLPPLRNRQRDPHQTPSPRRLHLAGHRRRRRRTTPPPVHRRGPRRLHRRPQSLQIPHGRVRLPPQTRQLKNVPRRTRRRFALESHPHAPHPSLRRPSGSLCPQRHPRIMPSLPAQDCDHRFFL